MIMNISDIISTGDNINNGGSSDERRRRQRKVLFVGREDVGDINDRDIKDENDDSNYGDDEKNGDGHNNKGCGHSYDDEIRDKG